jgi:hypothetical protein
LGNRAPAKRKRDVLLELAHEHVRRQTRVESRNSLVKSKCTDAVKAPCPPVVSSAKGDKIGPVAAQMASYLRCLCSSARFALCAGGDVVAGIVLFWAGWWLEGSTVDELVVGRRDVEKPVLARRVVDGGDAREEAVCFLAVRGKRLALIACRC